MSEPVALFLTINGVQVQGESEQTSLGRAQSIECVYYHQAIDTPTQVGSGQGTGRRQYGPLLIRKPVDKASPLIARALIQNSLVDAVFKFFRPRQDGTLEQFYTTHIRQARIASFRQYVPDVLEPATAAEPPLEEVTFVFQSIEWTHSSGGVTYQDSWLQGSSGAGASGPEQVLQAVAAGRPSRVARAVPLTAGDQGPETRLGLTRRNLPQDIDDLAPEEEMGIDVGVAPPYVPVRPT